MTFLSPGGLDKNVLHVAPHFGHGPCRICPPRLFVMIFVASSSISVGARHFTQ